MRKTLAKWLVVGALAGFGLVVGAEVAAAQSPTPTPDATVQNDNTAKESEAGSGDASGSNQSQANAGPSDFEGDTSATIAQEGDNEAEVNQEGQANSGDAVAGSQVSGVVSEGGSTSVTGSNTSEDAEATSGDATVNNSANVQVGPRTGGALNGVASDFEGDVSAVIVQEGDNETDVSQSGTSNTGDAVAGGQIAGIVGAGDISVDSTNVADGPEATTGDSEVDNAVETNAGPIVLGGAAPVTGTASSGTSGGSTAAGTGAPSSVSGGSAVLPSTPARSADFEGNVRSTIAQEGDNSVDASQEAESNSGDAVAGGQVTGLVASEAGSINVVNQQASEDADAESGESNSSNAFAAPVTAGPITTGGGAAASDFEGDVDAVIVQEGDNDVETAQDAEANTGDAVAGAQVVGLVAEGGSTSIVLSNVSEDADAESGEGEAVNFNGTAFAGPLAVGGGDVTGTAGSSDFEGDVSAVIAQEGDNSVDADQSAEVATGDAVAGSQVVGAVTSDGGDVAIDASNVSEDDEAESGEGAAANVNGALLAGPINAGGAGITGPVGASDFEDDVTAVNIAQDGDNETTSAQDAESATGDAVAGGQVFGVVAAGDVDIVASNTSEDAEAESGESVAVNANVLTFAGPLNVGGAATTGTAGTSDFEGAVVGADIAQDGDNDAETDQSSESASGDAVAGGQVFGVVTEEGGSVAIDATNVSEDAEAESGESVADNDVVANLAGPLNVGGAATTGTAGTSDFEGFVVGVGIAQDGDNSAETNQDSESATGDAVAGGQVFGVVASGSVDIVASNVSEDAEAESGESVAGNDVAANLAGPINVGGAATTGTAGTSDFEDFVIGVGIAQEGDNDASNNQSADAASGDAVAGGQVFGVVASGAVAIDATNVSEDDEAETGSAEADNDVFTTIAGPLNVGGAATTGTAGTSDFEGFVVGVGIAQEGDNDLETDQSASSASGDAVAGGQVFGVVAAGSVDIVASNVSEDADAESGDSESDNAVFAALAGPINLGGAATTGTAGTSDFEGGVFDADIAQEGDNSLDLGQNVDTDSGDAVAGAQIFGVVTEAGGDVAIDATNISEDSDSESGDAEGSNSVFAALVGPLNSTGAGATTGTAGTSDFEADVFGVTVAQEGDNDLSASQSLSIDSGDAVSGGQVMGVVASGSVDIVQSNTSEDDESETGTGSGSNAVGFAQIGPFVGPTLFSGPFGAFIA